MPASQAAAVLFHFYCYPPRLPARTLICACSTAIFFPTGRQPRQRLLTIVHLFESMTLLLSEMLLLGSHNPCKPGDRQRRGGGGGDGSLAGVWVRAAAVRCSLARKQLGSASQRCLLWGSSCLLRPGTQKGSAPRQTGRVAAPGMSHMPKLVKTVARPCRLPVQLVVKWNLV